MFTFSSQFLQPLIKEFSAKSLNWYTAHTEAADAAAKAGADSDPAHKTLQTRLPHKTIGNNIEEII